MQEAISANPSDVIDNFHKQIYESAKQTAEKPTKHRPDWLTESEVPLLALIEERNNAFKKHMKQGSEESHQKLKEARSNLRKGKKKAKCTWQSTFAQKCRKQDLQEKSKEAWKMIFKLMEGFQGHYKQPKARNFKNKEGTEATNDNENLQILVDHYQSVFNHRAETDQL